MSILLVRKIRGDSDLRQPPYSKLQGFVSWKFIVKSIKKNGLYAHKEPFKSTYLIKRFPCVFLKTC